MSMTHILIADAHEVARRGLCTLIDKVHRGWTVCGEARTGLEAIDKAAALQPEVVTLAIDLGEMNGVDAAPLILHSAPKARLLVVTAYNNEQWVRDFIEVGARGYVLKSDSSRTIIEAIETILRGRTFFSERLRPMIESRDLLPRGAISTRHLTRRELEVLTMLCGGHSNKQIGIAFGISAKTAETHRTRLMDKLGVHSLVEVVHYAIRNGIVGE
jgi:DNA-binding NarL/FixJ family response regulator